MDNFNNGNDENNGFNEVPQPVSPAEPAPPVYPAPQPNTYQEQQQPYYNNAPPPYYDNAQQQSYYNAPPQQPYYDHQQPQQQYYNQPPMLYPGQFVDNSVMKISSWLGILLMMLIPCAGIIMLFVWAFGNGNENRKNFCKAYLIYIAILLGIYLLLVIFFTALGISMANGLYY